MDEYVELIPIEDIDEHIVPELELGKELLLESDNIDLGNTNIIDNINNIMIMANKVKNELQKTKRLKRENFVTINKMEWNCVDTLNNILDKIKKDDEN